MSALALGLIAALCWGFHDICVRFLSLRTPISACIFVVLTTGLVFHTGLTLAMGGFLPVPRAAVWASLGAGTFFVIATFGLYSAFQRGPVRLVAPLIASYPILSVAVAVWQGVSVSYTQWLAVLAIFAGVASVAALSDTSQDDAPPKGRTILYACIAALGLAGSLALGQYATGISHELPTTLIARIVTVAITVALLLLTRQRFWPGWSALPLLIAMGVADGIALLCVVSAGHLPDAQYASVASSIFGLLTIILAWALLKERMTPTQWMGCVLTFAGVGYLAV
jgi:drug/metabolite transporter (DMT)-like permease